ncbi:uncharacterized protein BCN122_II2578 [Burkholderia cenocepacia]|nr:uncharacterized protein BCN122_II2578 [Burkholderia cenocepacia]
MPTPVGADLRGRAFACGRMRARQLEPAAANHMPGTTPCAAG